MRTLLTICCLTLMTSCSHPGMVPLVFFSIPSVKPLVKIEPMTSREKTHLSEEAAAIFTSAVIERLEQKDRVLVVGKHPQFSVKMQLVQQQQTPHTPPELLMHIHLEILDMREEKPKVILQEVLSTSALVAMDQPIEIDWNNAAFRMSPLGLAHRKLSREIATRIEDYISLAKKGNIG